MATLVEMGVAPYPGMYPKVKIVDREDARQLVDILLRNNIPVNLREVPDEYDGTPKSDVKPERVMWMSESEWETMTERERDLANRIEHHRKNYPGTSLDI